MGLLENAGQGATGPARRGRRLLGLLRFFGEVRRGEAGTTLLLSSIVFLLLSATYIVKVLREALIMAAGGAELKSYAAAAQVVLLSLVAWVYAQLARRLDRLHLISAINLFFVASLLVFALLGALQVRTGIGFFLWAGIFNVTTLAQFWSFANDVFQREQGERLFGIVGIGGALGAILGARMAGWLFVPLGVGALMVVGAGLLLVCVLLMAVVERGARTGEAADAAILPPVSRRDTLQLFVRDRYLILLAVFTLLINWISTNGEYILDRQLLDSATLADSDQVAGFVAAFRARFFGWVNLISLLSQCFLVSRIMQRLGIQTALLLTPVVWLGSYVSMALIPTLAIIATAKTAENSANYSLQNTTRQALFLVTSRDAKYTVKTVIDTFVWRSGDVLAAGVVWLGRRFALGTFHFIMVNLGLVLVLLGVVMNMARDYGGREAQLASEPT